MAGQQQQMFEGLYQIVKFQNENECTPGQLVSEPESRALPDEIFIFASST